MLCREVGGAHLSGGKVLSHEHALEARGVQAAAQHHVLRYLVHCEELPVVLAVRARLRVGLRKLAHLKRRTTPDHHVGPCRHPTFHCHALHSHAIGSATDSECPPVRCKGGAAQQSL